MAFDLPLGCSGYVHALALAKALIDSGQDARGVLVLCADTYTRFIDPADRSVVPIFGDAGAATWIDTTGAEGVDDALGPFVFGADGTGAADLIVEGGALRRPDVTPRLYMDGPKIFEFCLRRVPELVAALLERGGLRQDDVDLWVFHQANRFMLERLRKKLGIAEDRFAWRLENVGNTVSSTIPLVLDDLATRRDLAPGARIALVGFGVGYSWGAGLMRWSPADFQE